MTMITGKMEKQRLIAIAFIISFLASAGYSWGYEFQKGMCYVTWNKDKFSSRESDASLKELKKTGTEWLAIVTTWYQDKCYSTEIYPNDKTPTDSSIVHAINEAHSLGMKVMLKPHLDLIDVSDGSWRGDIACSAEPDWKIWFENYRDFILHYAKLAEENKVEMLCIGTELSSVATIKQDMWKDVVIKTVKAAYKGPLTYAANWSEEFANVTFWDELDYVGIDAYFPLSEEARPSLTDIKKGWEQWVREIEEFQKKVNKPIVFLEVGYFSAEWTAKTPWEEISGGKLNLSLQQDCYMALFETFWDKPWFYGAYWWKWGPDTRFGGAGNKGYSPQGKPAQDVVTIWYNRSAPKKGLY